VRRLEWRGGQLSHHKFVGAKFSVKQHCFVASDLKPMLMPYFLSIIAHPISSWEDSAQALVLELEVKFPNHEFMLALGVVYLNFLSKNS
jgi:hypothetical protein